MGGKNTKPDDRPSPRPLAPPEKFWKKTKWSETAVSGLVKSRTLAPLVPPGDDDEPEAEECPICCISYPGGMNSIQCCRQLICSDCFFSLQVPSYANPCPFCSRPSFRAVSVAREEVSARGKEATTAAHAERRHRLESVSSTDGPSPVTSGGAGASSPAGITPVKHVVSAAERTAIEREMSRMHANAILEAELAGQRKDRGARVRPPLPTGAVRDMSGLEALLRSLDSGVGAPVERGVPPPPPSRDLDAIEEMMVLEVMRQSLLEAAGPTASGPAPASSGPGPSAYWPRPSRAGTDSSGADDEEEVDVGRLGYGGGRMDLLQPSVSPLRAPRDYVQAVPVTASAPAPPAVLSPATAAAAAPTTRSFAGRRAVEEEEVDEEAEFQLALRLSLEPQAVVFSPILSGAPQPALPPPTLSLSSSTRPTPQAQPRTQSDISDGEWGLFDDDEQ